jgi:hypothetical protein
MPGLVWQTGAAANEVTVENTVARVSLNDRLGAAIAQGQATPVGSLQQGVPQMGRDWRANRQVRLLSDGQLSTQNQLLFTDNMEGVAVNSNKWLQTLATHTATFTGGQALLNAGASIAINTGALHTSLSKFLLPIRGRLVARTRQSLTAHFTGHAYEAGFGSPTVASGIGSANDGAYWQKATDGSWSGVINVGNATSVIVGTLSNAALVAALSPGPSDSTFFSEVDVGFEDIIFRLIKTDGTIIAEFAENASSGAGSFTGFQVHKLGYFFRESNQAAVATAVQVRVGAVSVYAVDQGMVWSPLQQAAFDGRGTHQNPVNGFTSQANYIKDTAPTTRTLVGTAAGEVAVGGLLVAAAMAGGNTDLLMFGIQNTSNYTLMLQGVTIPPPLNQVVAVATTQTTFEYFLALNSSSGSLAAGSPRFVALPGFHTAPIALAAGGQFSGSNIAYEDAEGVAIQPGRFLQIGCRALFGTATATETFLWNVLVKGKYV